jgi:hypothetical protein
MASTSPLLLSSSYCATPPLKDNVVYPPRIFVRPSNSSVIIISRRRLRLTAGLRPKSTADVYTVFSASSVPRRKMYIINPEDTLSTSTNVAKTSVSVTTTLLTVAVWM